MRDQEIEAAGRQTEAGFTLIEALVAIVVLVVGIIAVANVMVVAGTSNTVGNHSTAATAVATQQMELLKATPITNLVPGGDIVNYPGQGPTSACNLLVAGSYNCNIQVPGVGRIHAQWVISPPIAVANPNTLMFFIQVVAQSSSPMAGQRSQASFTTFRSRTE